MSEILIYFREDTVELWSLDQSSRLLKIKDESGSNIIPLYFDVSDTDIKFGAFAEKSFKEGRRNTFGNYWGDVINSKDSFNYYGTSVPVSEALSLYLKRVIESKSSSLLFIFEPSIDTNHRKKILHSMKKNIPGVECFSFDFYLVFSGFLKSLNRIESLGDYIDLRSHFGDLYLNYIKSEGLDDQKILKEKGVDPRLEAIYNYVIPELQDSGCRASNEEIRNAIKEDAQAILKKLPNGLVDHQFENPNLSIFWYMSVHRSVFDEAMNHANSSFHLEQQVNTFLDKNSGHNLPKMLSTEPLNVDAFHGPLGLSDLLLEEEDDSERFISFVLKNAISQYSNQNDFPTKLKSETSKKSVVEEVEVVPQAEKPTVENQPEAISNDVDVEQIISDAEKLMADAEWEKAILKWEFAQKIDPKDRFVKQELKNARANQEQLENIDVLYDQVDEFLAGKNFEPAKGTLELILKIKPTDRYAKKELPRVEEAIKKIDQIPPPPVSSSSSVSVPKKPSVTKPPVAPKKPSVPKPPVSPKKPSVPKPPVSPKKPSVPKPPVAPKKPSVPTPPSSSKKPSVPKPPVAPKRPTMPPPSIPSSASKKAQPPKSPKRPAPPPPPPPNFGKKK